MEKVVPYHSSPIRICSICMPKDLYEMITEEAAERGISISAFVREILISHESVNRRQAKAKGWFQ